MKKSDTEKAMKYVFDVKERLLHENRFYTEDKFRDGLDRIINDECETIEKGRVFYRARVYNEEDRYNKWHEGVIENDIFKGYNRVESFVNLKNSNAGRGNPEGISYLYMSSDRETCALEVCSKENVAISIAQIRVNKDLKVVDLSANGYVSNASEWLTGFKVAISDEINKPILDTSMGYIFTQYICEYFKRKNIDGVQFNSTNHSGEMGDDTVGKNLIIFSYDKCEAISSQLYLSRKVSVELEEFKQKRE